MTPAMIYSWILLAGFLNMVGCKCPEGATETVSTVVGGFCFEFVDKQKNWHDAAATCKQKGGRLLEIPSEEVQNFIDANLIAYRKDSTLGIWIGLKRARNEDTTSGDWFWQGSNKKVTYTNWAKGQPEMFWNAFYDPEECAYMAYDNVWQWSDFPCTDTYWGAQNFICEYVGEGNLDTSGGIYHGSSDVTEMPVTMETSLAPPTVNSGGNPNANDGGNDNAHDGGNDDAHDGGSNDTHNGGNDDTRGGGNDNTNGGENNDASDQTNSDILHSIPHETFYFSLAGFAVACVLLLAIAILLGVYCVRRRRQRKQDREQRLPLLRDGQHQQHQPTTTVF